jgi:hypothetical protein
MQPKLIRKSQSWLFWHNTKLAVTWGGCIYLPDKYYTLDAIDQSAFIQHEKIHLDQQERDGICFIPCYFLSREKRKKYELEAYKVQFDFLVHHQIYPIIEQWAKIMSEEYAPLDWITYEEAKEILKQWI